MVIDFHTHVFPDELAPRAISTLLKRVDYRYPVVNDGTVRGLLENMERWAIDVSVLAPVITKPTQLRATNEWVRGVCSEKLVGFGGIFPHTGDYKQDIDFVAGLGLRGLKFHAEYQDFVVDEPRMLKIYDYALSKGLILLHHAGFDAAFPAPYKSSPLQFLNIVNAMKGGVIVAAHLGGHAQWDAVEEYLAGSDIYLDTSMGFEHYSRERFLAIAKKHGADKLLFASDSPWSNAGDEAGRLREMPLEERDKEAILSGNAKRILNI